MVVAHMFDGARVPASPPDLFLWPTIQMSVEDIEKLWPSKGRRDGMFQDPAGPRGRRARPLRFFSQRFLGVR